MTRPETQRTQSVPTHSPYRARLVYVHGFGGHNVAPAHAEAMRSVVENQRLDVRIDDFPWESRGQRLKYAAREFEEAKSAAPAAARELARAHFSSAEPLYLAGYSLGSLVILSALRQVVPENLHGVFLMGAAIPCDFPVEKIPLKESTLCYCYYSRKMDKVLALAFRNVEKKRAAGEVGFSASKMGSALIRNLRVQQAHLFGSAYQNVARSLAELVAYLHGHRSPVTAREMSSPVSCGGLGQNFFDTIHIIRDFEIQRHVISNHYRGVDVARGLDFVQSNNLAAVAQAIQNRRQMLAVEAARAAEHPAVEEITGAVVAASVGSDRENGQTRAESAVS